MPKPPMLEVLPQRGFRGDVRLLTVAARHPRKRCPLPTPPSNAPTLNSRGLKPYLATAQALADASGAVIRPYFRKAATSNAPFGKGMAVENKAGPGAFDPVTAADKAAERIIRKHLAAAHPDHAILGEEYGGALGDSGFTWVIDPIDGTKAFITGMPLWGTLIGLAHAGQAVLGLMDQPFTGERVWAAGSTSQWRLPDGRVRRMKTRACRRLEDAMLGTTSPDLLAADELAAFQTLKADARLTRYGGDCYAYCLVAAGHIDLVVECGLKPHDVMALIPIIEQAGGRITTWDGEPAETGGRIVASGDPHLHDAVLKRLQKAMR